MLAKTAVRLAGRTGRRHSALISCPESEVPAGFWSLCCESRDTLEDLLMTDAVKVGFVPFYTAPRGVLVAFCDDTLKFGPATIKALGATANAVKRAAEANQFKGKSGAA